MAAINELIDLLIKFTPDQLETFLSHEITLSILRPEEASEFCLLEASSNVQ
jgi:hypothetical protein